MEIPKVYKALMEVAGRLESVIAGLQHFKEFKQLIYKEGEVTYAPEGSIGIFVYQDIDGAKDVLMGNKSYTERGLRVVHEATPLGKRIKRKTGDCFEYETRYPAILLGKEVWRDEPKVSEENALKRAQYLLGGDIRTCTRIGLHIKSEGRSYSLYVDGDAWVLYEGSRGKVFCTSELIRVADFIDQDKPKEEWVDVTKECELRFLDNYPYDRGGTTIEITHCGSVVTRLGIGQPTPFASRYKVVEITHNYLGQMSTFKILKKVVK